MSPTSTTTESIHALHSTLKHISHNPYPHVRNPENCKKRASVALILRVRPSFSSNPATATPSSLEQFFAQEWVQDGDAEAIFIKRAAREGDRWTSHVALPGGKRDPEDEDDRAVAVRETAEEIGLDLKSENVLFVGSLPERVVSTSWGKVPLVDASTYWFQWLMVLGLWYCVHLFTSGHNLMSHPLNFSPVKSRQRIGCLCEFYSPRNREHTNM
jgi:8-oxo-dGTP pyrophosphatase MutT (NUDIX family)